jgi:hypothetical protein
MKASTGLFAIAVLLSALATGVAVGQPRGVVADIPFAFYVGDVELPAGAYRFALDEGARVLKISGREHSVYRLAMSKGSARHSRSEAIFHKYPDGSHFLQQVWISGQACRELPKSTLEAEVSTDWRLQRIAIGLRPDSTDGK